MAHSPERQPLLRPRSSDRASQSKASFTEASLDEGPRQAPDHSNVEDDVLPEDSVLGRNIGWSSAYIIAISRVIGSGIFAVPGVLLKSTGSVGLSLSLWVLGAVVTACGLAVTLEYGSMLPRSGGDKVYLEFTYTRPRYLASTMVATQAVLLGFTASNCIVFSQYFWFALDIEPDAFSKKLLALVLLTAVTVIHGCWYRAGIRLQNFLGWIKVALVLFMVVSALYVVLARPGQQDASGAMANLRSWDDLWDGSDWSFGTLATSLFKVFYSYAGLGNLSNVMNEVKNPVRTLKTVSVTALVTACLLYLLANLAYFAVVPIEEIKASGQLIAALFFERTFGPQIGRRVLPLAVALSAAGNVMVVTFALVSNGGATQVFSPR